MVKRGITLVLCDCALLLAQVLQRGEERRRLGRGEEGRGWTRGEGEAAANVCLI